MDYDLAIIGGGISGAGVAQAAAAAGYSVLLVEKTGYGSQTSSSSSKLIHGGLRYLESGQFHLVRKALKERRSLLKLAPGLVKPVPFFIPVYHHSRRSAWQLRAGLSLYALLSGFEPLGLFKQLPRCRWSTLKGLNTEGLVAVFQYWDAQTDDQLLTRAVVASARELGAETLCPARFMSAEQNKQGYRLCYEEQHQHQHQHQHQYQQQECQVRMVVNAAGPWVNEILKQFQPQPQTQAVDWVQGSHLVLDRPAPSRVYYLESIFDQRVIFVMPWQGKTLVGTTEVLLNELPDKLQPSSREEAYLLGIYQHYFPEHHCRVIERFAGVRVLPHLDNSMFDRPRDTLLYRDPSQPQLLTLYGGKLTTFRALAKEVVAEVAYQLGGRRAIADVDRLSLLPQHYHPVQSEAVR